MLIACKELYWTTQIWADQYDTNMTYTNATQISNNKGEEGLALFVIFQPRITMSRILLHKYRVLVDLPVNGTAGERANTILWDPLMINMIQI